MRNNDPNVFPCVEGGVHRLRTFADTSPTRVGATGLRPFQTFASSRQDPRGSTRKPPFPHTRPAIDAVSSMLHPSTRGPCRFVLVFAQLWLHEDGMHRRRFFAVLGAAITAARTPCAQQQAIPVIGYLGSTSPGPSAAVLAALRQGLGETGWVEGRNLTIEYRWMEGRSDRLPALVADLVGRNVDVIVAGGPLPALALKSASSTIPIVFNVGMDPVG